MIISAFIKGNDNVSAAGMAQSGPIPSSVDCIEREKELSLSNPLIRKKFSKNGTPEGLDPPLSNRYGLLESDVDSCTDAQPDGLSPLESSHSQQLFVSTSRDSILDHPPYSGPLMDQTSRDLSSPSLLSADQTSPFPTPLSTRNPLITSKPVNKVSSPKSSSVGRTPFPSHSSFLSQSSRSNQHCLPPRNRKNVKAITSVDLEKMMAPRGPDPWYEDDQEGNPLKTRQDPRVSDPWDDLEPEDPRNKPPIAIA